jgi:putative membrane protein
LKPLTPPAKTEDAMRFLAFAILSAALFASPALGQFGNPAGVDPGTPQSTPGVPAPHHTNVQDRLFAKLAGAGGLAEVELGKLADRKAENSSVKEFARRMVEDHTKANEQLVKLANHAGIALPGELDPEHKAMKATLDQVSGTAFDLMFMQGQVVDHQKTATLLLWEIDQGQEAELQRFAAATLPIVLAHLEHAKALAVQLNAKNAKSVSSQEPSPAKQDRN